MHYQVGLDQTEPGRWTAWVLGLPGCFARASTRTDAIAQVPQAIADFFNWRDGYKRVSDDAVRELQVEVAEEFQNYETLDGYWVNSFFAQDRMPLSSGDIDDVRWLLSCTRSDLITMVRRFPSASLDQPISDERFGSVSGILKHVATAERWYFDRLGLALPKDRLGPDPLQMIEVVRAHTLLQLPKLARNPLVCEAHGEQWSPRKVIRRTLWHERVHTWHLQKLLPRHQNH